MTKDQWHVVAGLLILLGLEVIIHPTIKGGLMNFIATLRMGMSGSSSGSSGGIPPTAPSGPGNQCPPGYVFVPIAGGTTGTCVKAS